MGGRGGNNKRPGGHGGGRGGKKAKYLPNKVSNQAFPLGSRGLLITCDSGWEDRAVEEIYGVIEEHYDKLAGTASTSVDTAKDFSAALAAEVAQLKDKKQKRFQMTHVGVKGVVFCEFPKEPASPTPVDVAVSICEEAFNTKTLRGRHVNRLLPVSNTCYASLEEMAKIAPGEMSKEFPKDGPGVNFAVEYEHRSSDKFDRMAVINAFVNTIETPPHKVNLTSASKTILVQIARNSCGVSVVPRYKELCKFNLKTCAQVPEEGDEAAEPAPKEKDAQAEEVKEGGAAQAEAPGAQPTEGDEATKPDAAPAAVAATGVAAAGQGQPADAEDAAAVT